MVFPMRQQLARAFLTLLILFSTLLTFFPLSATISLFFRLSYFFSPPISTSSTVVPPPPPPSSTTTPSPAILSTTALHSPAPFRSKRYPLPDLPPIYHTARVFASPARYSFPIIDKGNNILRFHFHPLNFSNINLGQAQFHELLNDHVVLATSPVWPVASETLGSWSIKCGSMQITLWSCLCPIKIRNWRLSTPLRVSVGGVKITPFNDSLWRTWIPDDEFFKTRVGSEKLYFGGRIKYRVGGASREHFACFAFNVYVNGYLAYEDLDLSYITKSLASPFYTNFLVDGGDGVLSVSVCPSRSSMLHLIDGILNAVEVMKLKNSLSSLDGEVCADFVIKSWSKGNSTSMLFTLVVVVCIALLESRESVSWSRFASTSSDDSVKN
ncbi:hypothetical protein ACSQ67_025276 [Phaseolus vulgaris]